MLKKLKDGSNQRNAGASLTVFPIAQTIETTKINNVVLDNNPKYKISEYLLI